MAKRVIVKPGDIFYVTIKGKYRRYFQYIVRDRNCFNADLIRVFKRQYDVDETPEEEAIVNDEVAFYTHTFIGNGVKLGYWDRYGKKQLPENLHLQGVLFGYFTERTPLGSWAIYSANGPMDEDTKWPGKPVEAGELLPYNIILERLETGVDMWNMRWYNPMTIKRIVANPFPEAEIYATRHGSNGLSRTYYKYIGKFLVEEIQISDFKTIRIKSGEQVQNWYRFTRRKLTDFDWDMPVSEYEYEAARRGCLGKYLETVEHSKREIEKLLLEKYYRNVDYKKYTTAIIMADFVPCGYRVWLDITLKKTKEVISSDAIEIKIPEQPRYFARILSETGVATCRKFVAETQHRTRSFLKVNYVDSKQFGVYRDFLAEGYEF